MARPFGSRNHNGAPCSVADCDRDAKKRGWCIRHYKRWEKTGTPTGTLRRSASARFWAKVQPADIDACWLWLGFVDPAGYGHFERTTAHRFAYIDLLGDPGELHLDHLCRTKQCVNPFHLDPVTADENNRRARAAVAA